MASSAASSAAAEGRRDTLIVKCALVGDAGTGKTSLMVRYVERRFDQDYNVTLGVQFLEKTISLPQADVCMSLWDLGGDRSFASMLPLVTVDAVAVLFLFDLSSRTTLTSIREWYRQCRGLNKNFISFLVGTKFDIYSAMDRAEQEDILNQARKFAKAMKAPLVFTSSSHGINVLKLFKLVFEMAFSIDPSGDIEQRHELGEPILEYSSVTGGGSTGGPATPATAAGGNAGAGTTGSTAASAAATGAPTGGSTGGGGSAPTAVSAPVNSST